MMGIRLVALASDELRPANISAESDTRDPAAEIVLINATTIPATNKMSR